MSAPYDVSRFKEHLATCKAKVNLSTTGNTQTLDAMFSSSKLCRQHTRVLLQSKIANTSVKFWPCPGLTEADDERISQYLGRTQLSSGGGISERILADEMFGNQYSSLTSSQKEAVTLRQQQTHRWQNDHLHQRIFAIGETKCSENVSASVHGDHTTVKPCIGCKSLLSLPAFLTAITKQQPSNKNRAFIPRRHQNSAVGNMHIKILGLGDLLSEVRLHCAFPPRHQLII